MQVFDGVASGVWNLAVLSTYISVLQGGTSFGNEVIHVHARVV